MPSQHGSSAHSSNVPQSHSSSSSMTLLPQLRRNSICERGQKQTKRSNAGRILRKGGGAGSKQSVQLQLHGVFASHSTAQGAKTKFQRSFPLLPNQTNLYSCLLFRSSRSPPIDLLGDGRAVAKRLYRVCARQRQREEGRGTRGGGDFAASLTSLGLLSKQSPWPVRSASI